MKTNHTPGPWINRDTEIIGPYKSNKHICEITGNFMDKDEAKANAQLIAASPQLLQSLQIMTSLCRVKYGNLDPEIWEEIQKAELLIQKATE